MSASNILLKSENEGIQLGVCRKHKGTLVPAFVIMLLCFLSTQKASAQKNYIFRVQSDHVQAVTDHVELSGGTIRDIIDLDTETLVSANGPSRVKSQIRRLDGVLGVADDIEYQGINPALPAAHWATNVFPLNSGPVKMAAQPEQESQPSLVLP